MTVKVATIPVGVLSLLSYSVMIPPTPYKALRSKVRAAMGMTVGAPELVFGVLSKGSVDPFVTWLLAALKFWHFCLFSEGGRGVFAKVRKNAKGCLLSRLQYELAKLKVNIDLENVWDDDSEVRWVPWWPTVKPKLVAFLKRVFHKVLELRRPTMFAGLKRLGVDVTQHRRLLDSLSSFDAKSILRVWGGVALTKAHRHHMDPTVSPECECGHATQDLHHLLLSCPCRPCPPDLAPLALCPPCVSSGLLCPPHWGGGFVKSWRDLCRRAVHVLAFRELDIGAEHEMSMGWDQKGHVVSLSSDGTYAYCSKCYICRLVKDAKFIVTYRCKGQECADVGSERVLGPHCALIRMEKWKVSSMRPQMKCRLCEKVWWATSKAPTVCVPTATAAEV